VHWWDACSFLRRISRAALAPQSRRAKLRTELIGSCGHPLITNTYGAQARCSRGLPLLPQPAERVLLAGSLCEAHRCCKLVTHSILGCSVPAHQPRCSCTSKQASQTTHRTNRLMRPPYLGSYSSEEPRSLPQTTYQERAQSLQHGDKLKCPRLQRACASAALLLHLKAGEPNYAQN
jgi:hypothetical protein